LATGLLLIQEKALKEGGPGGPPQGASYASITWIRFHGSSAFRAELSAFVVPADGRLAPRIDGKLGSFARSVKSVKIRFQKFYTAKAGQTNLGCSIFPVFRNGRD
jgi:hypothetical protein